MGRDAGNTRQAGPTAAPGARPPAQPRADGDEPVLPGVSSDERDVGWGEEAAGRDEDWYRRERPPHHE